MADSSLLEEMRFLKDPLSPRISIEAHTDRLYIRSYLEKDFDESSFLYSDKELTQFFDHGEPRKKNEIYDYLEERGCRYFNQGVPFGIFSLFLKETNQFVGQIDLVPTENPGEVEIGWIIRKEFHHQGLCTESVLEFLMPFINKIAQMGYTSNGTTVNRVIATAHPKNIPSNKIIQKAGLALYQTKLRYDGKPRNWYFLELKKGDQR